MSEPKFRAGQMVKAEWPDGQMIIGMIKSDTGGPYLVVPTGSCHRVSYLVEKHEGVAFTVVKEPPIPEPTGTFAMVLLIDGEVLRRVNTGNWYPYAYAIGSDERQRWDQFCDQVAEVLYPGLGAKPERQGKACSACGDSNESCLRGIRMYGNSCCSACYSRDTHEALKKEQS